jgi:hypothetical protein
MLVTSSGKGEGQKEEYCIAAIGNLSHGKGEGQKEGNSIAGVGQQTVSE